MATIYNVVRRRCSTPILRTFLQVLVALVAVTPAVVALMAVAGIHIDPTQIAAVGAVAIAIVTMVMNIAEAKGKIPEISGLSVHPVWAVPAPAGPPADWPGLATGDEVDRAGEHAVDPGLLELHEVLEYQAAIEQEVES